MIDPDKLPADAVEAAAQDVAENAHVVCIEQTGRPCRMCERAARSALAAGLNHLLADDKAMRRARQSFSAEKLADSFESAFRAALTDAVQEKP